MLNQLVLVGRLTSEPVFMTIDCKKIAKITLAVPRPYKNEEGQYDTDFIEVTLWNNIAENIAQYCKKGDLIGVKGRVESNLRMDGSRVMELIAEKVTFLSSTAKKEGEE